MTTLFDEPRTKGPEIVLRPYQTKARAAVLAARDRGLQRVVAVLPTGTGKCLGRGTPVLMYDGRVIPVEDVIPGELVMGPDSRPRRVVNTVRGREMLYKVAPVKGDPWICNSSHILSLVITNGAKLAKQFPCGSFVNMAVSEYIGMPKCFKHCAKQYRVAVDFAERRDPLPIDPYVLGLWLGDGTCGKPQWTTPDPEVITALRDYAAKLGLRFEPGAYCGAARNFSIVGDRGRPNPITCGLRSMGVIREKRVPFPYRSGTRETRLAVLAGLIDTDGSLSGGGYDITLKQWDLADDVAFIARSLGLAAYVSLCKKTCTNTGAIGDYHRVSISGDVAIIPVRVRRRIAGERRQKKDVLRTGITIDPIGVGNYFGFELSGPDHLFLLGDFTVTHNTSIFSKLIGDFTGDYGDDVMVLAHRDELLTQAADRIATQNPLLPVSIEGGNERAEPGSRVVVAGVQSVGRPDAKRLGWFHPRALIIDECHHSAATTYQNVMTRFGSYDGTCFTLGVTATDHRMDNKPLHGSARAVFEDVVFRYSLRDAIGDGWLCDLRGFRVGTAIDLSKVKTTAGDYNQAQLAQAVNTEARNHAAYRHWAEVCRDRRTIVFCVDVQHAKDVAKLFRERGVEAEAVDGAMKHDDRKAAMHRFRGGATQVLCNVELVTEGVDVPEIACVLLLRPTKSWALFTQMVGRGLRLSEGKADCIVIDVVDATVDHKLGERPEERPGIAGLVGLPPGLDLEGHTVAEALTLYDEMSGVQRSRLFQRPDVAWEDLATGIQEVDLLAELSVPEELKGATRLAWMKVSTNEYLLSCGEQRGSARIDIDELGRCAISIVGPDGGVLRRGEAYALSAMAFRMADQLVSQVWPDCAGIVAARAAWRDKPPSEGQVRFLHRLGVDAALIARIHTMGDAAKLIDSHKAIQGRR